jgi:hypothetical protein
MINNSEDLNKYYNIVNQYVDEYIDKWKIKPTNLKNYLLGNKSRLVNFLEKKGLRDINRIDRVVSDVIEHRVELYKDGVITSGTWAGTALTAYFGGTGQQTYTDGQLLIGNTATNGITKANLSPGFGISIVNGNGSITINNSRPVILTLASGFTPVGIGTDYNILRVPEGKNNANTNYNIRKIVMGVGTTSSGTSTIRVEKSSGPHTGITGFSNSSTASTGCLVC